MTTRTFTHKRMQFNMVDIGIDSIAIALQVIPEPFAYTCIVGGVKPPGIYVATYSNQLGEQWIHGDENTSGIDALAFMIDFWIRTIPEDFRLKMAGVLPMGATDELEPIGFSANLAELDSVRCMHFRTAWYC